MALRVTTGSTALRISEYMSVSSSALLTGDHPPGFFPPLLHRVGNDLVQLVGGVVHRSDGSQSGTRLRSCRVGRLPSRASTKVFPHNLGNRIVSRCKMPAQDFRPHGAFQVFR